MISYFSNRFLLLLLITLTAGLSWTQDEFYIEDEMVLEYDHFEFLTYSITNNSEGSILTNNSGDTILTSSQILPLMTEEWDIDEFGEPFYVDNKIHQVPYAMVINGDSKFLYSIEKGRRISDDLDFSSSYNFVQIDDHSFILEISTSNEHGYYIEGMPYASKMNYEYLTFFNNYEFVAFSEKKDDPQSIAFTKFPSKILYANAEGYSHSSSHVANIETVEELIVERIFKSDFILIHKNDKYGIITSKGKVFEPTFENFNPDGEFDNILHIELDNLFGIINTDNGDFLKPQFKKQSNIVSSNVRPHYFAEFKDDQHYIGIDGRKYLNTEGKAYFSESEDDEEELIHINYNAFTGKTETTYLLEYEYVNETSSQDIYQLVSKNGKHGLIDNLGNILLECNYDDIGSFDYDLDNTEDYFTIYQKKNIGIYSKENGLILEPYYNDFELVFGIDYNFVGIIASEKSKKVLFNAKGEMLIEPYFKDIESSDSKFDYQSNIIFTSLSKKKNGIFSIEGEELLPPIYKEFTIFDSPYDVVSDFEIIVQTETKEGIGLFSSVNGELIPAMYDNIESIYQSYDWETEVYVVSKGKLNGLYDHYGHELFPAKFAEFKMYPTIHESQEQVIITGVLDGKIYANVNSYFNSNKFGRNFNLGNSYNLVFNRYGYKQENSSWLKIDLLTEEVMAKMAKGELEIEGDEFVIFEKDGLFGAKNFEDIELVEAIYSQVSFMDGRPDVMIGYENDIMYYIYPESGDRYTEEEW